MLQFGSDLGTGIKKAEYRSITPSISQGICSRFNWDSCETMQNFGNETGNQVTCVVNQCEFWYNLSGFEVLDGNQTKFPDFT